MASNRFIAIFTLTFALSLGLAGCDSASESIPPASRAKDKPSAFISSRHMDLDEIEPGMRGYGMTVFAGTEPEPFEVVVRSVEHGSNNKPGKSVIWIECPETRMQKLGPVKGMSGSPIYLWPKGTSGKKGSGGRLIGAFAFGYSGGKGCHVGVQPIRHMLDAAGRTSNSTPPSESLASGSGTRKRNARAAAYLANQLGLEPADTWRWDALAHLASGQHPKPSAQAHPQASWSDKRMMLPLSVGSGWQASLLQPFIEPLGLTAVDFSSGTSSGNTPKWIDPQKIKLKPGSALSIPLAFGPIEMSVLGTATEVLPDGKVLGFGHQLFARGDIAVPMATAFVHFIQPNRSSSFKLGGAISIQGSIIRDEYAAVVGTPKAQFKQIPVTVKSTWPGERIRVDHYKIVHFKPMLSMLIGTAIMSAINNETDLPEKHTVELNGKITFDNGKSIEIQRILPGTGGSARGAALRSMISFTSPIDTLTDNIYQSINVASVEADVTIRTDVHQAIIRGATLAHKRVRPGQTVVVDVDVEPFQSTRQTHQVKVQIPTDMRPGKYTLYTGGPRTHFTRNFTARPHLRTASNAHELFEAVNRIARLPDNQLYAVIQRPSGNTSLAIGQSELPDLPSSKAVILQGTSAEPFTKPFGNILISQVTVPYLISNEWIVTFEVVDDPDVDPIGG